MLSYEILEDRVVLRITASGPSKRAATRSCTLRDAKGRVAAPAELMTRVDDFRHRCATEHGNYRLAAAELYRTLVAPAEPELKGRSHLVLIPDGFLANLSFAPLLDGSGRHLVEQFTLSYAPSVEELLGRMQLAERRRRQKPWKSSMLAVGLSDFSDQPEFSMSRLSSFEEQARRAAAAFRVPALTGRSASEWAVKRRLRSARFVHFATHARFYPAAPMYTSIALRRTPPDDGQLYAYELFQEPLQAEFVLLSACETGLTPSSGGALSLPWTLFEMGATGAMVTLWEVRDDSATALVTSFYENWRNAGRPIRDRAQALRLAQLQVMRAEDGHYAHPFHWAPYCLIGDWR